MKKQASRKRNIKAAVMAEFVLSIPILLSILFFIIEFGNLFYYSNTVNYIARAAARYAAMNPTASESALISQAGSASAVSDVSGITLTVTPAPGATRNVGDTLTVEVEWDYVPIFNPFNLLDASHTTWAPTITSTAISRVEVAS